MLYCFSFYHHRYSIAPILKQILENVCQSMWPQNTSQKMGVANLMAAKDVLQHGSGKRNSSVAFYKEYDPLNIKFYYTNILTTFKYFFEYLD